MTKDTVKSITCRLFIQTIYILNPDQRTTTYYDLLNEVSSHHPCQRGRLSVCIYQSEPLMLQAVLHNEFLPYILGSPLSFSVFPPHPLTHHQYIHTIRMLTSTSFPSFKFSFTYNKVFLPSIKPLAHYILYFF